MWAEVGKIENTKETPSSISDKLVKEFDKRASEFYKYYNNYDIWWSKIDVQYTNQSLEIEYNYPEIGYDDLEIIEIDTYLNNARSDFTVIDWALNRHEIEIPILWYPYYQINWVKQYLIKDEFYMNKAIDNLVNLWREHLNNLLTIEENNKVKDKVKKDAKSQIKEIQDLIK